LEGLIFYIKAHGRRIKIAAEVVGVTSTDGFLVCFLFKWCHP